MDLALDPADWPVLAVLMVGTAAFVLMRYRLTADRCAAWTPGFGPAVGVSAHAGGVVLRRLLSGALLGGSVLLAEAVAALAPSVPAFPTFAGVGAGLALPPLLPALAWAGAPLLLLAPLLWRAGGSDKVRASHPEIRDVPLSPRMRALSLGSWVVYLAGYEYLFRGGLLFTLAAALGPWPAIVASTALYSLAHLHKPSMGEALGSLPLGLVFGAMALATGSFLPAVAVHVGIAWTTEISAARRESPA